MQRVIQTAFSFPPNYAAVLMVGEKELSVMRLIACVSINGIHVKTSAIHLRQAFPPVEECKWTVYLVLCEVVENMRHLSIATPRHKNQIANIPFREPIAGRHEVVVCFGPLFLNDRWQLLVTALEIYRHYGASLQVFYIQSMLTEIFSLLRIYEDQGYVKIEPWARIDFGEDLSVGYDPNAELNWRNQESALCDCLLNYKEAASFIIFADLDDVLVPHVASNYLDEFRALQRLNHGAAAFLYGRSTTTLKATTHWSEFSLESTLGTAIIAKDLDDPKCVVDTSLVHTVFIHWPGISEPGSWNYNVPYGQNFMIHLRHWHFVESLDSLISLQPPRFLTNTKRAEVRYFNCVLSASDNEDARFISSNFTEFIRRHAAREFEALPSVSFYYGLVDECYNAVFYSKNKKPDRCPGPILCSVPELDGVKCTIAFESFTSSELIYAIRLFTPTGNGFEQSWKGCKI
uniref:Glycosyltransferase family 92 protein n=1 Tax=Ascaris lumbricoides TaxID=6252 RepID=A0A0M3I1K3_ASCLU